MVSLLLVSMLSRDEHDSTDENGIDKDSDGVPHEDAGPVDTQFEHSPPMDCLECPEGNQSENDADPIPETVDVHALVVGFVNWVVSVSVAGNLRSFNLRWCRVN